MYHTIDELIVVVTVDDDRPLPGHILLVDDRDVAEEQLTAIPSKDRYSRVKDWHS
jgi:hypothetical protein